MEANHNKNQSIGKKDAQNENEKNKKKKKHVILIEPLLLSRIEFF